MGIERADASAGNAAKTPKAGRFLGSLKDALMAAARDDQQVLPPVQPIDHKPIPLAVPVINPAASPAIEVISPPQPPQLSAADAARHARTIPASRIVMPDKHIETEDPPTTRVVRPLKPKAKEERTQLVRGKMKISRDTFAQDPVVGFLVIVGGPGLGASRPIFEGNNTVGRTDANRIPLDFGDDSISAEAQAYIRYDSTDRSFLFVPNLAKTNVVSVNDKRPAGAIGLKPMDVITLGRTQAAFVPFCGPEFCWSELSEARDSEAR